MGESAGGKRPGGLVSALRAETDAEVRFDAGSRGAYSTDGSNYRQVPLGVVVPRTVEAGAHAVGICARFDVPVLSRGGGTSLAGQATNAAVVIDWTKYCHRLVSADPDARTCVVEPGIVLDELNRLLADHRVQFGPKPSTHSHCALGGMIGNNSCGASAQAYGKTADNVRRLDVLTYDGLRLWVGPTSPAERARIAAEGAARPRSTTASTASSPSTSRTSAAATRRSPAGCPATTSTRCSRRTAATWRRTATAGAAALAGTAGVTALRWLRHP